MEILHKIKMNGKEYFMSKGDPGEKGEQGEKGADGKSAYELAKEAGYIGTEEEFAEMLVTSKTLALAPTELRDFPKGGTYRVKIVFKEISSHNVFGINDRSTGRAIKLWSGDELSTENDFVFDLPDNENGYAVSTNAKSYTIYTTLDVVFPEIKNRLKTIEEAFSPARIGEVTLTASGWVAVQDTENLYAQVVALDGVTENDQVDLTPSVEQLAVFYNKDLAFVTENEDGVVTVYAIGQKPQNDYTIQVTITEVNV